MPNTIYAEILEDSSAGVLEYTLEFAPQGDEYVLFPACCYNGNQFDVLKKEYPPLFSPQEAFVDMPVTITDVPRLEKDGSGSIEVTTGDLSIPCVGVFRPAQQEGILLYTLQEIDGVNLGLCYQAGKISLTYPYMRKELAYRWPFMKQSGDKGLPFTKGQRLTIPYQILRFPCADLNDFYKVYFCNRKCMDMDDCRPDVLSANEQFAIQREKFNALNWRPAGGFYGVGTSDDEVQTWQPGWVGGGMASYALMKLGDEVEQQRAVDTLHHLFRTQTPSGFFYESSDSKGNPGTGFDVPGTESWHLLRKSADVLYFLFKHYKVMEDKGVSIPAEFLDGTRRLANAFVKLWDEFGQLGQFVDLNTGRIVVGGSTSSAIAPAGLAVAALYFNEPRYREVAQAAAEQYYFRDAAKGHTTGGPGEILQCPDSESAFALLESMVVLYEQTEEQKWLDYARHIAHLCSSWVVSYNYRFPPESEFGRMGMKTVGSVFANAQNKHSAPGICTLSGDSLYKLYKWTGEQLYLELLEDIALTISQYMSTNARPIWSWDVPKDASLLEDDSVRVPQERLPQGFICERVNMSDWESSRCIGGVFNGSCWPETSNLLTLAEVVPLLQPHPTKGENNHDIP